MIRQSDSRIILVGLMCFAQQRFVGLLIHWHRRYCTTNTITYSALLFCTIDILIVAIITGGTTLAAPTWTRSSSRRPMELSSSTTD